MDVDVQGRALPAIVERLLLGLVPALRSGEEAATLHARRLTTALQVSIPSVMHHAIYIHICICLYIHTHL